MRQLSAFVIWVLASPGFAQNMCSDLFSIHQGGLIIETGTPVEYKDEVTFAVRVLEHSYTFNAEINAQGLLSVSAYLAYPQFNLRSHLSGSELYRQMMDHFGARVKAIQGHWAYGDNQAQFFAALAKGLTPEQAALNTWSGRQAAHYGFSKVESVDIEKSPRGEPGIVDVIFIRP